MVTYVLAIVVIALAFDFINGFHDSANSIATIVGTRVLSPFAAVCWAAFFNFSALLVMKGAVAKAVASGFVDPAIVTPNLMVGALLGAIAWNLITWWYGIPSSSSHALIGGLAGAGIAKAGLASLTTGAASKWLQTVAAIVVSPLLGSLFGFGLMVLVLNLFKNASPGKVDRWFRPGQLASSAMLSLSHGGNDAQKTMGIIVGLLVSVAPQFANETGWARFLYVPDTKVIPVWVEVCAYSAISLGTLFGGWRIVHTMGSRITRLRPVGGFCAETGGALVIFTASLFGIPVSTTHTMTGSIVGVGASSRLRAVRWGIAGSIVWAWVLTIPASAIMASLFYLAIQAIHPL